MRLRNILASICFLAVALQAHGQEAERSRDFRFRTGTDPVFFLSNPAALAAFQGHISIAEIELRKDNGALCGLSESPDGFKGGAVTESYISVSDRISFHGKLGWSYFSGDRMGSQILMDPGFNPVNYLESTSATVGRRNKETYSLLGALSYKFSDRWAAGCSIDYVSSDQTKVKDPRFTSIWMDMSLKAGATFRPSERLLLGFAAVYRSTLEQVRGGIYGTTDKQYFTYTDKGAFYGTLAELQGDMSYLSVSNYRPMKNDFYGLSIELAGSKFSNELEALYRTGYWGKKSSSTPTFFEFSGIRAAYHGKFLSRKAEDIHRFSVDVNYELLGNNENIFKYVTPVGLNTRVEYTGSNHILDSHQASLDLGYVYYKDTGAFLPAFSAGGDINGSASLKNVVLYPYYRNSNLFTVSADAFARKNIFMGKSVFSLGLNALFRMGFGDPKQDGSYATTSGSNLISFDDYLYRQFEFDTAPAAGAGLEFAYTYLISERIAPYIKLSDSFSTLLSAPQYLEGRIRNVALITLGCNF